MSQSSTDKTAHPLPTIPLHQRSANRSPRSLSKLRSTMTSSSVVPIWRSTVTCALTRRVAIGAGWAPVPRTRLRRMRSRLFVGQHGRENGRAGGPKLRKSVSLTLAEHWHNGATLRSDEMSSYVSGATGDK